MYNVVVLVYKKNRIIISFRNVSQTQGKVTSCNWMVLAPLHTNNLLFIAVISYLLQWSSLCQIPWSTIPVKWGLALCVGFPWNGFCRNEFLQLKAAANFVKSDIGVTLSWCSLNCCRSCVHIYSLIKLSNTIKVMKMRTHQNTCMNIDIQLLVLLVSVAIQDIWPGLRSGVPPLFFSVTGRNIK